MIGADGAHSPMPDPRESADTHDGNAQADPSPAIVPGGESLGFEKGRGELSGHEAARLARGIAGLAGSGLPMPEGLRALGEEFSHGPLRRMLGTLASLLESGVPLDVAVEAQGRRFPAHLRGLVLVGARSGTLGQVLGRFIAYHDVGAELRRRTWLSLAYPILAITASLMLFYFVSFLMVNDVAPIYADFNVDLPLLTRLALTVSRIVVERWWSPVWILCVLAAAWIMLLVALPTAYWRSLTRYLPVLGWVWRWTSLAEFCHLLGLLLECDVPLTQAVRLAGEGVQDAGMDSASRRAASDIEAGQSLSRAVSRRSIFPAGLARLLGWAESKDALAETLHMAGDMFAAQARSQATFASTVYGVASVIAVLIGIGVFLVAIMLPLISLVSKLNG